MKTALYRMQPSLPPADLNESPTREIHCNRATIIAHAMSMESDNDREVVGDL
jgi:hypothetical protein